MIQVSTMTIMMMKDYKFGKKKKHQTNMKDEPKIYQRLLRLVFDVLDFNQSLDKGG